MGNGKRGIIRSPEAQRDLIAIWLHGADTWSPQQADTHLLAIEAAVDRLHGNPELGRPCDELIAGLRSIPALPHIIFYRQWDSKIEIVRVLHQLEDEISAFH